VTAESASDLAAEPRTDNEIRSSPHALDAFAWLTGAADAVIAWSGRHLRSRWWIAKVVAVWVVAAFFMGSPNYPVINNAGTHNWAAVIGQARHPFAAALTYAGSVGFTSTDGTFAAAALARQDLRRLRHLAMWAAVVSLLSLNYSVDFSGLQMNVSPIRPFPAQLVSTRGHLL
jgi:hypothetical protein